MASFLDDFKTFGIVAMILGLISVVGGIITIALNMSNINNYIWSGIGEIIYGALVLLMGYAVFSGGKLNIGSIFSEGLDSKYGILTSFVGVVGLGCIITSVFDALQHVMIGGDFGTALGAAIVGIVIGAIILIFAFLMKDGKQTVSDKIIFIVLAILFILEIILAIFVIIGSFGLGDITNVIGTLIVGIATMLMYLMLALYLFSPEVKSKLGM